MDRNASNPLPALELPKRWEILEEQSKTVGIDPGTIIQRVDSAAERLDQLMAKVNTHKCGLFEIFYGLSGSGKTTFLKTIPKFFANVRVCSFPKTTPLVRLRSFVEETFIPDDECTRIVLVEGRDNPKQADVNACEDDVMDELRECFRTDKGRVLVIWPITRERDMQEISRIAWEIGRDSVCDIRTHGVYRFSGLEKRKYYDVADITARNLSGDSLEAYGIIRSSAHLMTAKCSTLTEFFFHVDEEAAKVRNSTWSVLRERIRPKVWIVLPGDIVQAVRATVAALTQGTQNRIDIDLIAEFIDLPDNKANYVADWRERRARLAHLLRALDVRLFDLPPNVALAAVRSCGDDSIRGKLNQSSVNMEHAKKTLRASRLYKTIALEAGLSPTPFAGSREVSEDTSNEYRRVQASSSKNDKPLNHALGKLISLCLEEDGATVNVVSEKESLPGSSLKPDIRIGLEDSSYICLEPTWRSTNKGIEGEMDGGQNTLSEAHIKKYVLEKVTAYVKDLGL